MDNQTEQALKDAFAVVFKQMDMLRDSNKQNLALIRSAGSLNEVLVKLFDYTVRRSDEKITALEGQVAEMQKQIAELQNAKS